MIQYVDIDSVTWVEPFCSSLTIPIRLQPNKLLLNDLNNSLMCFWDIFTNKEYYGELCDNIKEVRINNYDDFNNLKTIYLEQARKRFFNCEKYIWKAAYFYLLIRHGHSHKWRVNKDLEFNNTYNKLSYKRPYSISTWNRSHKYLTESSLELSSQDYQYLLDKILKNSDKEDYVVYLHPPQSKHYKQILGNNFHTLTMQIELSKIILCLTDNGVPVFMLSHNSQNPYFFMDLNTEFKHNNYVLLSNLQTLGF